jgi:hypothetical protein
MNVQIERYNKRFAIKSKYDPNLISAIQKIEKRFWDAEKYEWTLPIAALDTILNEMNTHGITYEIKDKRPIAIVTKTDDKYEIKFGQYINQQDINNDVSECVFDRANRKFVVPADQKDNMINFLKNNSIKYIIDDKKKKNSDSEDDDKRTKKPKKN